MLISGLARIGPSLVILTWCHALFHRVTVIALSFGLQLSSSLMQYAWKGVPILLKG